MVILMHPAASGDDVARVVERIHALGLEAHVDRGDSVLIGVRGDTTDIDEGNFQLPGVRRVRRLSSPHTQILREQHPADSVVMVGSVPVGGPDLTLMAGPCAVETRAQILGVADRIQAAGGSILRGGAYKPRTSPRAFRGLRARGLEFLREARERYGLPVVTEITSPAHIELFERAEVDLYQVGARNMFNYELLRELGRLGRPVLLKRSFSATLEEFVHAAEYLMVEGNSHVILCERGIRTFEPAYRFTLDLNAVAWLRDHTHLPVIVDPSHGTGSRRLVPRLAMAAVAAGAQGLLVEVHPDPGEARSDAAQQLTPDEFAEMAERVRALWRYLHPEPVTTG